MTPDYLPRASDVMLFRYTHVAVASAWLWDALTSIGTEVDAFILRRTFVPVDYVYLLSRLLTLVIVICEVIIAVTPLGPKRCNNMVHIISSLATATTCLGTFLFLVRVRSALFQLKCIREVFTIWWFLASVAVISTVPFSFTGSSIVESNLCAIARAGKRQAIGSISIATFDCAVFVSISVRVLALERRFVSGRWAVLKAFIIGSNIGPISRTLLRTGQLYYIPMTILLTCLLVFEFSSIVPEHFLPQCQAATYLSISVFYNIMACRVFCLLRLFDKKDNSTFATAFSLSDMRFHNIPRGDETTYSVSEH